MRYWIVVVVVCGLMACEEAPQYDTTLPQVNDSEGLGADAQLQMILDKIKQDPGNSNYYHELGYYYFQQENMHDAVNNVYKAIAIDTAVSAYYYTLGEIYLHFAERNMNDELLIDAKMNLDRCIAIDSANYMALSKLGWLATATGNYQQAFDYLDEALRADEHYPEAYYNKGLNFLMVGDTASAASSFQTATEMDANYYDAYIQVGVLYALRPSKHAIAENAYNTAMGIDSSRWEAYYDKGILLQEQGRAEEALATYDDLIKVYPTFVDAYYNKGWVYMELMDSLDRAVELFTRSIELAPENHMAFYNRGVCYERMGNYEQAASEYRKSLAVQGDYDLAALGLSRVEQYLN